MSNFTTPTPEQLGIPAELYDVARNYVIKNKREGRVLLSRKYEYKGVQEFPHPFIPNRKIKRSVWEWVNYFKSTVKNSLFGITLVEMLQYYLLDFGFVYGGKVDDNTFIIAREEPNGASIVIRLAFDPVSKTFTWNQEETSDEFSFEWKISKLDPVTKKYVTTVENLTFNAQEIADTIGNGTTAEDVMLMEDDFWTGIAPESDNDVKEVYSVIKKEGDVVSADLFINGKSWTEFSRFGDLVFPFGKAGQDFQVQWRLFDGNPNGNLGESVATPNYNKTIDNAKRVITSPFVGAEGAYGFVSTDSAGATVINYNVNKPAWLKFEPELLPDQGKNPQYAVYINLHTGEVSYTMSAI